MRLEMMILGAFCAATVGCTLDVGTSNGTPAPPDANDWWEVDAGLWQIDAQPADANTWQTPDAGPWQTGDGGTPVADAGPQPVDGGTVPVVDGGTQPIDAGGGVDASQIEPDAGVGVDCQAITSEAICVVTPECEAFYEGVNCQCYPDGTCSCESWEFSDCE